MKTIYVQIASYRDNDLFPTISDCLAKAKYPERITFGICWQTDDNDDALKPYVHDKRIKLYRCHWIDAKGCCWARNITNKLYETEDYTLQVDSHSRFEQDWDEILIGFHTDLGDDFAVYSGYPPSFELDATGKMTLHDYTLSSGILSLKTLEPSRHLTYHKIVNETGKSVKSRFIAAGFVFARGHLISNVPYDPHHYYLGEEIAYAVRAFTHGYNIYTPPRVPIYHLYYGHISEKSGEHGKRIRVHDHVAQDRALARLRALVVDKNFSMLGEYGPGCVRTIEDYEHYAGLDFKTRKVHLHARTGRAPDPITCENFDWTVPFLTATLDYTKLMQQLRLQDLRGCHVTACDESGVEALVRYYEIGTQFYNTFKLRVYLDVEKISKLTVLPLYKTGFGERVEETVQLQYSQVPDVPSYDAQDFVVHNEHQSYVIFT